MVKFRLVRKVATKRQRFCSSLVIKSILIMNFFYEHLAHGVVGLAAVASLGLGGGVAAHTIQTHADSKARIEVRNEADKREHKEAKHSTNVAPKHVDITIGASGRVLVHGATVIGGSC